MMSYLVREETADWHRVPPRAPGISMTPENMGWGYSDEMQLGLLADRAKQTVCCTVPFDCARHAISSVYGNGKINIVNYNGEINDV